MARENPILDICWWLGGGREKEGVRDDAKMFSLINTERICHLLVCGRLQEKQGLFLFGFVLVGEDKSQFGASSV